MNSRYGRRRIVRVREIRTWIRQNNAGPIIVALVFIIAASILFVGSLVIGRMISSLPATAAPPVQQGPGGGAFVPTPTTTPTPDPRLGELLTQVANLDGGGLTPPPTEEAQPPEPTATLAPPPTPTGTLTPTPTATATATSSPMPMGTLTPTATATVTPSPTPTPTVTAVPVYSFKGGSIALTDNFQIMSDSWLVDWRTDAIGSNYSFKIILGDPSRPLNDQDLEVLVDEDVGISGTNQGAVVIPQEFGPGTYYLKVFGPPSRDGGWEITVRENP